MYFLKKRGRFAIIAFCFFGTHHFIAIFVYRKTIFNTTRFTIYNTTNLSEFPFKISFVRDGRVGDFWYVWESNTKPLWH
jgi:hypothetical protein